MRAVVIPRHGGAEVMTVEADFPEPVPARGEVLVRVAATTVNQMDLLVRNGYPNQTTPLPHIPGGDIAGTVAGIGDGVSSFSQGERVLVYPVLSCGSCTLCRSGRANLCTNWQTMGIHHRGGYGELVCVPAQNLVRLPDGVDFENAATLPVAGMTAHHALSTVGKLEPGEIVAVWGAGGGIGSMAVQVAKRLGAKVAAITCSAARRTALEQIGVDLVVDRSQGSVDEQIRRIAPEGVDMVFDTIGGETFPVSLAMLRNGGRLVSCGIIGGRETPLNIHMVYYHHLSIHGVFLGTVEDLQAMLGFLQDGSVVPRIDRVLPLEEAAAGQRLLESGEHVGKIVLKVEE